MALVMSVWMSVTEGGESTFVGQQWSVPFNGGPPRSYRGLHVPKHRGGGGLAFSSSPQPRGII